LYLLLNVLIAFYLVSIVKTIERLCISSN